QDIKQQVSRHQRQAELQRGIAGLLLHHRREQVEHGAQQAQPPAPGDPANRMPASTTASTRNPAYTLLTSPGSIWPSPPNTASATRLTGSPKGLGDPRG